MSKKDKKTKKKLPVFTKEDFIKALKKVSKKKSSREKEKKKTSE